MTIKVIIAGFKGKMGSTAVEMVKGDVALSLAPWWIPLRQKQK